MERFLLLLSLVVAAVVVWRGAIYIIGWRGVRKDSSEVMARVQRGPLRPANPTDPPGLPRR